MEGRRGHLQFHTFIRRFVYRWHLAMQGMNQWPKVSKYMRKSQKLYSINCGQNGHVYKTNIRTFMHSFYTLPWWCVFLKHKIKCWPHFFSAQIEWLNVLSILTVHLLSKNRMLRQPGRSIEWFCMAPLGCGDRRKRPAKFFLTMCLIWHAINKSECKVELNFDNFFR